VLTFNRRKADLILAAFAACALAAFYIPYFSQTWSRSPWGDTIYLTGPMFCEISRNVKAGSLALVNWSSLESLDYNPHVAPYYPFYLFKWLDFCSASEAVQASDIIGNLHVFIFFIGVVHLIKTTGTNVPAAVVGAATVTTLNNTFELFTFPTIIAAAAWIPAIIDGFLLIQIKKKYLLGITLLITGLSLMLTAGPGTNLISTVAFFGLILAVFFVAELTRKENLKIAPLTGGAFSLSAICVIILSIPSTLNLYAHLEEFIRWTRSGAVIGSAKVGATEILAEQLSWHDLPQLIAPTTMNFAVGSFLVGPSICLLALYGVCIRWRSSTVRYFAVAATIALLLVFLFPSQIVLLWSYVPGLNHTRHLSLLGLPLTIAAGVLAAHGLEALLQNAPNPKSHWWILFGASIALLVPFALAFAYIDKLSISIWLVAVFTGGSLLLFWWGTLSKSSVARSIAAFGLVAIHFALTSTLVLRSEGAPVASKTKTWQSIENALTYIRKNDTSLFRIAFHTSISAGGDISYLEAGSIATYAGMLTFTHYSSPRIYWKFKHEIGLVENNDYARYGGKYLISRALLPETLGELVYVTGDLSVYKLQNSRPLISLSCAKSDKLGLPTLLPTGVGVGQLPLVPEETAKILTAKIDQSLNCSPTLNDDGLSLSRSEDALDFYIPPGKERLLTILLPPYSSWQLSIGGKIIPIYAAEGKAIIAKLGKEDFGAATLTYNPATYKNSLVFVHFLWLVFAIFAVGVIFSQFGVSLHRFKISGNRR
jgi:hypothetical protein